MHLLMCTAVQHSHQNMADLNVYTSLPVEQDPMSEQLFDSSYLSCTRPVHSDHSDLEHYPYNSYVAEGSRDIYDYDIHPIQFQNETTPSNPPDPSQEQRQSDYGQQRGENTGVWNSAHQGLSQVDYRHPLLPLGQPLSHVGGSSQNIPTYPPFSVTPPPSQPTLAQASQSPCHRRYTLERWIEVRPAIQELYINHGFSLSKTKKIMEDEHDFVASVKQYKNKFKAWGFKKNHSKND